MEIVDVRKSLVSVKDYRECQGVCEPGQLLKCTPLDALEVFAFQIVARGGIVTAAIERDHAILIITSTSEGEWQRFRTFEGDREVMMSLARALYFWADTYEKLGEEATVLGGGVEQGRALLGARSASAVFIIGAGIREDAERQRLMALPEKELRKAIRERVEHPAQLC